MAQRNGYRANPWQKHGRCRIYIEIEHGTRRQPWRGLGYLDRQADGTWQEVRTKGTADQWCHALRTLGGIESLVAALGLGEDSPAQQERAEKIAAWDETLAAWTAAIEGQELTPSQRTTSLAYVRQARRRLEEEGPDTQVQLPAGQMVGLEEIRRLLEIG